MIEHEIWEETFRVGALRAIDPGLFAAAPLHLFISRLLSRSLEAARRKIGRLRERERERGKAE